MILYMHSGSANHGCEAIVRSTMQILNAQMDTQLYSYRKSEDEKYELDLFVCVQQLHTIKKGSILHIILYIKKLLTGNANCYYKYYYRDMLKKNNQICLSIGGDTYCYGSAPTTLALINRELVNKKCITILWGCSIEPQLMEQKEILEDLGRYALITVRESITYEAMENKGLKNAFLFPDPAFTLEKEMLPLPINFIEGNTIGINISPLVEDLDNGNDITYINYFNLVKYILGNTDDNVALIPHVVTEHNNDLKPLTRLYEQFAGTTRVILIGDCNCMQLKGYISRCRMFIGARTHATIAAYSTCVPTLVVGYSVKARGIAKDIFGTDENYVMPVQSLKHEDDLIDSFKWLQENENSIRQHLIKVMPMYIQRAWNAGEKAKEIMAKTHEN